MPLKMTISECISLSCLITFSYRAQLEINKRRAHWFYISRIHHNKACAVDRCWYQSHTLRSLAGFAPRAFITTNYHIMEQEMWWSVPLFRVTSVCVCVCAPVCISVCEPLYLNPGHNLTSVPFRHSTPIPVCHVFLHLHSIYRLYLRVLNCTTAWTWLNK